MQICKVKIIKNPKNSRFRVVFRSKIWILEKNVVPLHPLSSRAVCRMANDQMVNDEMVNDLVLSSSG